MLHCATDIHIYINNRRSLRSLFQIETEMFTGPFWGVLRDVVSQHPVRLMCPVPPSLSDVIFQLPSAGSGNGYALVFCTAVGHFCLNPVVTLIDPMLELGCDFLLTSAA